MNKFTVPLITAATIAPIVAIAPNANASTTALHLSLSSIRSSQKAAVVPLYKGQGITFNLSRTDETITNIIIDDHSQIVPITEVPLCPANAGSGCSSPGAKTLHLKRIDDIYKGVAERPVPKTNTPLLTIWTRTQTGEVRVNTFVISLRSGSAKYHSVEVYPDAEYKNAFLVQDRQLVQATKPAPIIPDQQSSEFGIRNSELGDKPLPNNFNSELLTKNSELERSDVDSASNEQTNKPKEVANANSKPPPPQAEQFDLSSLRQGFEILKPKLSPLEAVAIRRMFYLVEKKQVNVFRAAKLSQVSTKTLANLQISSDSKEDLT